VSLRPATRLRIEAAHRFSAFYRGDLANHLPMALLALDAMGASDEDVAAFDARYQASHLEPLASHPAFASAAAGLGERIAREGREAVLRSELPRLLACVAAGAFHGAIRTAYAIEAGIDRELAHALAYWSLECEPLPHPPALTGDEGAQEILASIARDPRFAGRRYPGRNIAERLRNAAADPAFAGLVARLDPRRLACDEIAAALIRAYAASGDFTVLHGVTGTHAFRLLAPFASDPQVALADLWQSVVAAYLGAGSPAVEGWRVPGNDALAWDDIRRLAARCEDEHDVKLAYTCWREGTHSGDDLYRRVASSRVCHALRETMAC
jgi:hypothetical protein